MTRGAWGLYPAAFGLLLWPNMALAHEPGEVLSLTERILVIWLVCLSTHLFMFAKDVFDYLLAGIMLLLAVVLMFSPVIVAIKDAARGTPVDPPHAETGPEALR